MKAVGQSAVLMTCSCLSVHCSLVRGFQLCGLWLREKPWAEGRAGPSPEETSPPVAGAERPVRKGRGEVAWRGEVLRSRTLRVGIQA